MLEHGEEQDLRVRQGLKFSHYRKALEEWRERAAEDSSGCNILHFSAASGNVRLLKKIHEELEFPFNSRDKMGRTCLHYTAIGGKKKSNDDYGDDNAIDDGDDDGDDDNDNNNSKNDNPHPP